MTQSTACPDWERRIVARESLITFAPEFAEEANASLAVFKALRMADVAGSPTLDEISRDWVTNFVAALFGSYNPETGRRQIQEALIAVAKKNGKSSLAAGVMMTALIRNWRRSAEFLIIAPTVEIASNSFYPARDMVRMDEELSTLFHVQDHVRTITHRVTQAQLKVVAADSDTVGGKKASGIFVDELHLFGPKAYAENMFREAMGGLASRPEGFVIYATTQSDEPPTGVFLNKLMYARGVRDGRIQDPRFLPLIYEFPSKMLESKEYLLPENFYITNPNLGLSVDEEFLTRELAKAQEAGEESLRGFASKHLNVEIGQGLKSNYWPGALFWEPQSDRTLTLDELIRRSEVITIGIDGGGLDDMLGIAVLGREESKTTGAGRWLHWGHAWIHPIALERRKSEATRYKDFARDGDLTIVSSIGEDVAQVADIVEKCEKSDLVDQIGVDAAGIGSVIDEIVARKFADPDKRIVTVPQGWRMNSAIKTAERKLADESLVHGGSPLMAWSVANAKVEARGNAIMITKQVSGSAKIDPLMAMFNAVALMAMNPKPRKKRHQIFIMG